VREAWSSDPSRASEYIARKPVPNCCKAVDVVPFGGEPQSAAGRLTPSERLGQKPPPSGGGGFTSLSVQLFLYAAAIVFGVHSRCPRMR
jgi:hypothetical protein